MLGNDYRLLQHTQSGAYLSSDGSMFTPAPLEESSSSLWDIHPLSKRGEQSFLVKIQRAGSFQNRDHSLEVHDVFQAVDLQDFDGKKIDSWVIEKIDDPQFSSPFGFSYFLIYALVQRIDNGQEEKIYLQANDFSEKPYSSPPVFSSSSSPIKRSRLKRVTYEIPNPSSLVSKRLFKDSELLKFWHIRQVAECAYKIYNAALGICLNSGLDPQKTSSELDFLSLVWEYDPLKNPLIKSIWTTSSIPKNYSVRRIEKTDEYHLLEENQVDSADIPPEESHEHSWRLVPLTTNSERDLDISSFPDVLQLQSDCSPSTKRQRTLIPSSSSSTSE